MFFFYTLERSNFCSGNTGYDELCKVRAAAGSKAVFYSDQKIEVVAAREEPLVPDSETMTVRHVRCSVLVPSPNTRCTFCQDYSKTLNVKLNRAQKLSENTSKTLPNSTVPWQVLSEEDQKIRRQSVMKDRAQLLRKVFDLEQRLKNEIESEGVRVERERKDVFTETLKRNHSEVAGLPEDNPLRILWEQQEKMLSLKNSKSIRWHPLIIKWRIALRAKSSSAYNLIRESGFLKIPHVRTLDKYTNFTDVKAGFNEKVLQFIHDDIKLDKLPDHEKNIAILFDEIKLKSGLAFSRRTGKLLGYADLGTFQNELKDFERKCSTSENTSKISESLATHMLVLMARGLFSNLHVPVAYFPSRTANSHELSAVLWEGVETLESMGFKVRAFVSDGASANRKFYRSHATADQSSPCYYTTNRCRPDQKIYFICDVPHLLKTTRNNWENSGWNLKSRDLHVSHLILPLSQIMINKFIFFLQVSM